MVLLLHIFAPQECCSQVYYIFVQLRSHWHAHVPFFVSVWAQFIWMPSRSHVGAPAMQDVPWAARPRCNHMENLFVPLEVPEGP